MVEKLPKPRLAWGSFGAGIFTLLGPAIHFANNPDVPAATRAADAAVIGAVVAAVAVGLGIGALKWSRKRDGNPGTGWAYAGITVASIGAAIWIVALLAQ
jgi:hypothetical protein